MRSAKRIQILTDGAADDNLICGDLDSFRLVSVPGLHFKMPHYRSVRDSIICREAIKSVVKSTVAHKSLHPIPLIPVHNRDLGI